MNSSDLPFQRRQLIRVDEPGSEEFSVVTYNILADYWIRHYAGYSYCPEDFKVRNLGKHSPRHKLLMTELCWLDGDILCLQEVDTAYFSEVLKDELSLLGYEALFFEKSGVPEGVALAFRREKFKLEKSQKIHYKGFADYTFKQPDVLKVEEVFILAALRHKNNNSVIAIGATHIKWGEFLRPVTQVCEIALIMQALGDMVTSLEAQGEHVAHILCGDFNIEPQFPAYEFLKEGRLTDKELKSIQGVDYIRFGSYNENTEKIYPDELSLLSQTKDHLLCPLSLHSAYKNVTGAEPQFTNHEGEGNVWTLDYIWFDANTLNATAVLQMVPESVITTYVGLPNQFFPSDHLSLKAFFKFKK